MLAELRYALPQLVNLFHWCRFNGLDRSQNYYNSIIKIHKIQKLFNHNPCNRHEQDDTIKGIESIRLSFIDTYLAWCMLIEVSHLCVSMSMHQWLFRSIEYFLAGTVILSWKVCIVGKMAVEILRRQKISISNKSMQKRAIKNLHY